MCHWTLETDTAPRRLEACQVSLLTVSNSLDEAVRFTDHDPVPPSRRTSSLRICVRPPPSTRARFLGFRSQRNRGRLDPNRRTIDCSYSDISPFSRLIIKIGKRRQRARVVWRSLDSVRRLSRGEVKDHSHGAQRGARATAARIRLEVQLCRAVDATWHHHVLSTHASAVR